MTPWKRDVSWLGRAHASAASVQARHPVLLAVTIGALLLTFYLYKPQYRQYGASWDTLPAQLLPISILIEGDLDLDEFSQVFSVEGSLPYSVVKVGNHILSSYPVLPGLANVPVFLVSKALGFPADLLEARFVLSMVAASLWVALSAVLFVLVLQRSGLGPRASLFGGLVYGLGSACFGSAIRGAWQHGLALVLINAAWLLAHLTGRVATTVVGLLLGLLIETRVTLAVLVLAVFVWFLKFRRGTVPWLTLGIIVPVLVMRVYAAAYWGSPWILVEYPIVAPLASAVPSQTVLAGLPGLLISPSRGLFVYSPVYLLAFLGIRSRLRLPGMDKVSLGFVAGAGLYFLVHAVWPWWWGGDSFGYRIITEVTPAMSFLAAVAWEQLGPARPAIKVIGSVLLAASIYANALGAYLYPCQGSLGEGVGPEPAALWDLKASDLFVCSRKLWSHERE